MHWVKSASVRCSVTHAGYPVQHNLCHLGEVSVGPLFGHFAANLYAAAHMNRLQTPSRLYSES